VDDDVIQIESLRRGLRSRGYCVIEAQSAESAMGCLREKRETIDVVLTDYVMPGLSGLDLLKWIRHEWEELPVIMMTAHDEESLIAEVLRNGCDRFIRKPFTHADLLNEILQIKRGLPASGGSLKRRN
jgi:DNA-binding response OmpR family regulator